MSGFQREFSNIEPSYCTRFPALPTLFADDREEEEPGRPLRIKTEDEYVLKKRFSIGLE